ncbi:hypothetical protein GUITHDRAFT_152167 [Guillardia theta CCMP2712]|uniref:Spt4/RpoE2 zinc finger domain-containing protein n=1 Tax=Guillardia theta (strain CCMP2712) TaxID=905079 RepID=L1JF52_GUITC|nr:hypothetical protein GUITHDRAFT_152167 [Guillardia theta CCMP2712]EKX47131.1 hypothetical protein GUITHDRAFT_152167 [Guillardia theta CCMP2712]|eukprot:XP_005834111.1 hypothetical protein GUITHDRAFT_152167 [Guillardia theta CCMP2712]
MADTDIVGVLKQAAEEAAVPNDVRQLRACLKCHLVLPARQFDRQGCANCGTRENYADEYCTVNFTGISAITQPQHSWVSRWLDKQDLKPGCYALEVAGDAAADAGGDDED